MGRVFREGTNPIWAVIVALYVVAILVLPFYWLITETGPMRWLADWQGRAFGAGTRRSRGSS